MDTISETEVKRIYETEWYRCPACRGLGQYVRTPMSLDEAASYDPCDEDCDVCLTVGRLSKEQLLANYPLKQYPDMRVTRIYPDIPGYDRQGNKL